MIDKSIKKLGDWREKTLDRVHQPIRDSDSEIAEEAKVERAQQSFCRIISFSAKKK